MYIFLNLLNVIFATISNEKINSHCVPELCAWKFELYFGPTRKLNSGLNAWSSYYPLYSSVMGSNTKWIESKQWIYWNLDTKTMYTTFYSTVILNYEGVSMGMSSHTGLSEIPDNNNCCRNNQLPLCSDHSSNKTRVSVSDVVLRKNGYQWPHCKRLVTNKLIQSSKQNLKQRNW